MRYIGLDIGDGESAATLVMDNGAMTQEVLMLGSNKNIISVVGMQNDRPVVGNDAMTGMDVVDRSVRFKSRFLIDNDSRDIQRFMDGLCRLMNQTAKHALSGDSSDIRIALGHPAGWSDVVCRRYVDIATQAGFPNVYAVSESRAAFLYVHYDRTLLIDLQKLQKPCLVIDIGSSTTDFAYIVDGQENSVGFGQNHLGGGLIDKLILEDAVASCCLEDQKKLSDIFAQYPSWYSECELFARKQKELYFIQESSACTEDMVSSMAVYGDINNPIRIGFRLNKEKMDKLLCKPLQELNGNNFIDGLKESLTQAKNFTLTKVPELLILTGGASRMPIFQMCCAEAFPNAEIILCPEPEFSIARGLGIAARIDYQMDCFRDELKNFFNSDILQKNVIRNIDSLKNALIPIISNIVLENGFTPALKLAAQQGIVSQNEFLKHVAAYIHAYMQDENNSRPLMLAMQKWISETLADTQKIIDELSEKYSIDTASLKLSVLPIRLDNLDLGQIKYPLLFAELLKALEFTQQAFLRNGIVNILQLLLNKLNYNRVQNQIKQDLMQDSNLATMLCKYLVDELRANLSCIVNNTQIPLRQVGLTI